MSDLLNPPAGAVLALLDEVTGILVQSGLARKIMCFGSVSRGTPDRWSDVDLLVITDTRRQFVDILDCLQRHKPIVHRNQFVPYAEPMGGHVLGVLFEGYSVFHCVDLNLLTWREYRVAESLARFGVTRELYSATSATDDVAKEQDTTLIEAEAEDPTEAEIKWRVHFTKKAIKKVLRGEDRRDEVAKYAYLMREVMRDHPADLMIAGRRIGYLATTYLQLADRLLNA